jgi:predicted nucleotidyltransferase
MSKRNLDRGVIIRELVRVLESLDYVDAFWEAGAIAFNRVDRWSDIDLYLVVDDAKVADAFQEVERTLESLSPIKRKYEPPVPPEPGIAQAFYKLERASEYLLIDLAIMQRSGRERFLEPEIHGNAVFHFNKSGKIKIPHADKSRLVKRLLERKDRLEGRMDMFRNYVTKEISRGNLIEAIDHYYYLTLSSLLEALRMKYNPFHFDFKTRYVHYELPAEVIRRLQRLYFVSNEKDLLEKYHEASGWFLETLSEIDAKSVQASLKDS